MNAGSACRVLVGGFALATVLPEVMGHGFLAEPPSRNVVASQLSHADPRREYCPHCLQGGGPTLVKERAGGVWPTKNAPESHGLCGDPKQGAAVVANWRDEPYLTPTSVQRTYTPGEVVEFQIELNAHHQGHYEFRICDTGLDGTSLESREAGQQCLDTWLLQRAAPRASCQSPDSDPDCQPLDEDHPERWYLPPTSGSGEVHKMRYRIPTDLRCSHCTLQWYYSTGNTCFYDDGYVAYFEKMAGAGWPASDWYTQGLGVCGSSSFGEEFWNCADVAVLPADEHVPMLSPSPAPPSPTPTLPSPVPQATPPTPPAASEGCVALWGKCGGEGWTGPGCCTGGYCHEQSQWYHQCMPGDGPPRPAGSEMEPEAEAEEEAEEAEKRSVSSANASPLSLEGEGALRGRRAGRHRSMMFIELARKSSQGDGGLSEDDQLGDPLDRAEL